MGYRKRRGGHSLVEDGVRGVVIGLGEDALDRSRSALCVRACPEGAEGAWQVVERHGRHDVGAAGLGDDPVLGSLTPRRGVIGRREGLNVAQLPDACLENRGSRIGTHTGGQGHHTLNLRALLTLGVVAAHARLQRRGRPHVEGVSRGIDEVIDPGRGGQVRDEVRR